MDHDLIALGLLLLGALGIGAAMLAMPRLFGARARSDSTLDVFECGVPLKDAGQRRMQVRFYLVAIEFIVFDVEAVFLLPWAVNFKTLGLYGFFAILFFLAVLTVGLIYTWGKGGLEWE
ncbi:MAG: NADH-quinone oxidoreductase subunit A [bacterium]